GEPGLADCLQVGRNQVAAGYILYGSSTMLVYTTGQGVHGFTLDPTIGEFLLSHPDIRTPPVGKYYSVNESNWHRWTPGVEQAGGLATDGHRPILDLVPKELHQKTPFIVGSKADVELAVEIIAAAGVHT